MGGTALAGPGGGPR